MFFVQGSGTNLERFKQEQSSTEHLQTPKCMIIQKWIFSHSRHNGFISAVFKQSFMFGTKSHSTFNLFRVQSIIFIISKATEHLNNEPFCVGYLIDIHVHSGTALCLLYRLLGKTKSAGDVRLMYTI